MATGRVVNINGDAWIADPDGGKAIIPHAPDLGSDVLGINPAYLVNLGKVFGGEVSMNYGSKGKSIGDRLILFKIGRPCPITSQSRCRCGPKDYPAGSAGLRAGVLSWASHVSRRGWRE